GFDNQLDIAETEAETLYVVNIPGRHAIVLFEDVFAVNLADADTAITHGDYQLVIVVLRGHFDLRPLGRILAGVVEKIVQHVRQVERITRHRRSIRLQLRANAPSTAFHLQTDTLDRLADQRVH